MKSRERKDNHATCSLAVVFLQYDPDKFRGHFDNFKKLFINVKKVKIDYYIVDNFRTGEWQERRPDGVIVIGGDNSCREFSGWRKGLRIVQENIPKGDLIMFVNDTYALNLDEHVRMFSDELFLFMAKYGVASGVIYYKNLFQNKLSHIFIRPESFQIEGKTISFWLRSNLIVVPLNVFNAFWGRCLIKEKYFPARMTNKIYKAEANISDNLKKYIINYLCPNDLTNTINVWHSRFLLNESTYDQFINKAMSIINEFYLTSVIVNSRCFLIDIQILIILNKLDKVSEYMVHKLLCFIKSYVLSQIFYLYYYKKIQSKLAHLKTTYISICG